MREMKDSGVEWIGEIPKSWLITKLKYLCRGFSNGTTNNQILDGVTKFPVSRIETISSGYINKDNVGYVKFCSKKYLLNKNDILISNINSISNLGNNAIFKDCMPLYHGMNLLKIVPVNINPDFIKYYFNSYSFKTSMQIFCKPAINQASVSSTSIKNFFISIPNVDEQHRIANFLDIKCSEIDSLSSDIEKQIEILKDYKKSVITEAVTKGLNPNVEMKDSGVEWIGKIPKDWEISKIKYLARERTENGLFEPGKSQYIGLENLKSYSPYIFETDTEYIISKQSVCQKGDVLFSKLRPYLVKVIISPNNCFCTGEFLRLMNPVCNVSFLRYSLLNKLIIDYIDSSTYGTKMPRVSSNIVLNAEVTLPKIEEQKQIADYLDQKCSEIDQTISEKQKQLEILAEYKKSVIYEYVTGKKEVPTNE